MSKKNKKDKRTGKRLKNKIQKPEACKGPPIVVGSEAAGLLPDKTSAHSSGYRKMRVCVLCRYTKRNRLMMCNSRGVPTLRRGRQGAGPGPQRVSKFPAPPQSAANFVARLASTAVVSLYLRRGGSTRAPRHQLGGTRVLYRGGRRGCRQQRPTGE